MKNLTVEYDATIYEKVWLTNDKAFYERIMSKKNAVPMMAPELVKNFTPVYLVGVLRDKRDCQDGDATQEK